MKTVTIERKSFMPRAEFRRKANALKQLSDEEKLYKATNPVQRDSSVTKEYRQEVIDRIWKQFHERNPEFADKLIERVTKRMQPDHVWELQLGGPDDKSNLRFLDSRTNEDIGIRQIRPQIARLPDGTPIRIEVIDE
ncbi:endonuclease [Micromonospora sp. HM5-17]|uniref:endonuclease n=1 Tax=Micromonospora sp. HM5-17 TaxID=2487710 RepID=UPI000F4A9F5E|nr:endonuclease [Micromonospora sp. HM5-17]ROT32971.1 endonuclease [Micromonospora sp. HM5-17]